MAILIATAFSLPALKLAELRREYYFFDIDLTSTSAGRTQVFFDLGQGYREQDSSAQPISAQAKRVTYRYMLPAKTIRALRFDPIDQEATLTLHSPRISDINGKTVVAFALNDLLPVQQIASAQLEGTSLKLSTTPKADDPVMEFKLAHPIKLPLSPLLLCRKAAPIWALTFISLYGIAALLSQDNVRRWIVQTRLGMARPLVTLGLISLLSVGLQCYPVIFFGRSFVSPNNGSTFYYGSFPSLPGATEKEVEDGKGSDVGAMLHYTLYIPSVQREAIFKHGELPLWDRYNTCGTPLLGQGQSMFGSLLNIIPILGDSSSWTWDLRYITSRWLFAFGLGLCVWLSTRCFRSAGFVSFVGVFVGFFVFRLNHMAQFSVDAAPWILIGWLSLRNAASRPALALGAVLLFFGNWEVFTSGTVKEACTLILCLNLVGLLSFLAAATPWKTRGKALLAAVFAGVIFLLLSAPIIVCFGRAMASSYTVSDIPVAYQIPGYLFIGLFDDFFYGRLNAGEARVLPSTNLVIYLGVVWALLSFRQNARNGFFLALIVVGTLAAFVVYSVIPNTWILGLPLVRNIGHVHNTFSCVLVVLLPVLAGFGFRGLLSSLESKHWQRDCGLAFVLMAWPVAYYFRESWAAEGSPFFKAYLGTLPLAAFAAYVALTSWRINRRTPILLVGLCAASSLLIWRNGQYLKTPIDDYVFNPGQRVDFRAKSPAAEFVSRPVSLEPSRPAGLHMNLFCGYNEILGWESIFGIEPLRNYNYDRLVARAGINKVLWPAPDTLTQLGGKPGEWHDDDLDFILPIQDMLGVRYYLDSPGAVPSSAQLHRVAALDLDVYESDRAWPRAFFTSSVTAYTGVDQFIAKLRSKNNKGPFAAIDQADFAEMGITTSPPGVEPAVPAHNYHFTSNKTTFTVDASGPGYAVLLETYFPEDFRAYVNGRPATYYRMNHSFKGVALPGAGTYEVRFEYWPRYLTAALWAAGFGLFLSITGLWVTCISPRLKIRGQGRVRPPATA